MNYIWSILAFDVIPSISSYRIGTVSLQKAGRGAVSESQDDILLALNLKDVAICLVSFPIQFLNWEDVVTAKGGESLQK